MSAGKSPLGRAFLEDHRALTRCLADLAAVVEKRDWVEARQIAERVDRLGGAHIEFEEEVLYPAVARVHGRPFVQRLHEEHRAGLDVVRSLLGGPSDGWTVERQEELAAHAQTAWRHAESCGTLLSQLTGLGAEEQRAALERLESIRSAARRWTQLGPQAGTEPE